uniref:Lupus La protein n=1 Tax=Syphacia muris TaxID=451379 RepID=A0A0N5ALC3_9BILA
MPSAEKVKMECKESDKSSKNEKALTTNGNTDQHKDLTQRIKDQVEFYLGDINLPRDSFFQEQIVKDDGWMALEVLLKCNRIMKLTQDLQQIAKALESSSLIQLSEDRTKFRRNPEIPLPENSLEYWKSLKKQTVYIKGFPLETKLEEIEDFVRGHGNIINILMRRERNGTRQFKGSVLITFKTPEEAEAFVKNDVTKFGENDLVKMMQNDYWSNKQNEIKQKKAASREAKAAQKKKEAEEQTKASFLPIFSKGLILLVENLPKDNVSVNKLKDFFRKYGNVAYCVWEQNSSQAQLRFVGEENSADKAWKAAVAGGQDGKVIYEGNEVTAKVLEGEAEEAYWNDFSKQMEESMKKKKNNSRNKKRRGRAPFRKDENDNNANDEAENSAEPATKKPHIEPSMQQNNSAAEVGKED